MGQPLGKMIIELGLDSANFSKGMKGIDQQIKTSMIEMKAHLNVMGRSGKEIDALKAKQVGLTGVIAAQNDKVALAKEKYEACKTAIEESEKATQAQKDALIGAQNEYVKAIGQLGSFDNQLKQVSIRLTAMESGLYKNGAAMVSFGSNMSKVGDIASRAGKSLTMGVSAPLLAIGAYAVKTTAEFDKAMSQVSAVSGAVGEDFQKLRDKSREMGEKTKFSATEAAEAMNYMAMAGWKTEDMLYGIEGIMNLAAASGENFALTSDIVTDALTGFGEGAKEAGRLADIMAAASSNSNTNVSMMGETFKYCTPIAGALGFSMEDTAEAIGLMANSGIKASMAGTAMRGMMNNLVGEVTFTGKAFGEMTIRTEEYDGSMRGLNDILSDCRGAFSLMTESEKVANAETLVGKNAMSGFLAVMNAAPKDIEKLNAAIAESEGAASAMSETMQDNLIGQLVILQSEAEELAISFGDIATPKIREMVSGVQNVVENLNKMDTGTKSAIVNVGLFTATVGPAVLIVGKLTSGIGKTVKSVGEGMQSFALWAAKITHTTAVTTEQTAALKVNTTALLAKTARTLTDAAATKAHATAEKVRNLAIAAGNGTLTAQVKTMNASIISKIKGTAATISHTAAEKASALAVGISTGGLSIHTVATIAQTTASNACAVATGILSAALKLLFGPVGWITAGIAALVAGVTMAVKWLNKETEASKELKTETEKLAGANNTLTDSLVNSQAMYDDSVKSIQAEAGAAKTLTEKVDTLSKVENKSAKQKKELQTYVGMLNSSMHGLNLRYDEEADSLSMATSEIYSHIEAMEQQAAAQAAQERMTEILKEQMIANEQLGRVQEKIAETTENEILKNKERKNILEDLTEQEGQLKDQLNLLGESYSYVTEVIIASSEAEAGAVSQSTQTILEAYGSIGSAYEDLGTKQQQAIDGIVGTYETMSGKLSDLTEQIKLDNETTWAEIQRNQDDTIAKTEEFSNLYAQLITAGVSESYLNAIGATGPESIPLLKEMLSQGTETILASQDEWQKAYDVIGDTLTGSLELDDSVRSALKDYVLGESGVYGTLQGAINDADLNALGKSLTEGVSKGIIENTDAVKGSATNMADETTDAAEEAWGIRSPSRVFADIGKNLMQGLVQGIGNNEKIVYAKATEVANKVTQIMKKTLDIHSPSRVMRDEIGRNIALGIAEGITQNAKYAEKSAEDIASATLQAARTKLENSKVYQTLTLADEAAYWDSVRRQISDGTQARIDADKLYFQSKKSMDDKMVNLETSYASKVSKVYEDLSKNIQSAQEAYTNKLTSRMQSIMDSMSLFDRFRADTTLSTTDLLGNLKSQVDGLNDWTADLGTLERRGVKGDMLEELRNMGTNAAGEIALMTEMTNEELDEYISLWKQKQSIARKEAKKELKPMLEETQEQIQQMQNEASKGLEEYKQEFVSAMSEIGVLMQAPLAQVQSTMQSTMASIVGLASGTVSDEAEKQENVSRFSDFATSVLAPAEKLPEAFADIGRKTVEGMVQGIREKSGELYHTMSEIIRASIQVAKDEAQIHSPSKAMMSIGSYMMEGLGLGIESMQGYVEKVAGNSAKSVSDVYQSALSGGSLYDMGVGTKLSNVLTDKTGVLKSIGDALEILWARQERDTVKAKGNNNDSPFEQLIESNNKMAGLLQIIAEKNLVIDKTSLTNAVDSEFGGNGMWKVRGAT